jgi:Family of unknown function (DUF6221)
VNSDRAVDIMSDLVAFLTARLDEDEAAAKAAGGFLDSGSPGELAANLQHFRWRGSPIAEAAIAHVAEHRPARVLREIDAKRNILAEHPVDAELLAWSLKAAEVVAGRAAPLSWCMRCYTPLPDSRDDEDQYEHVDWPCPTLRALAAVWSGHPDYDPEWA